MKHTADILLVTATEAETRAVLDVAQQQTQQPWTRRPFGGNIYFDLGAVAGASVFLVQSAMGAIGLGAAAQTVQQGIEALNPIAVIMVGIAFGMQPGTQRIGDVLIARHILLYEPQKVASDSGQSSFLSRGTRADVSPWLLKAFRSGSIDWRPPTPTRQHVRPPQVQAGLILTGEKLIDNLAFRDQLGRNEPEAIGGEMEGAGLYVAAHQDRVDWILVKAICDWADGTKDRNLRQRQQQAAHNVAHFVFHVIGQGTITRAAAPHQRPDKSDQTINNQAPNQAAQGIFYAPVYFGSSSPMPRDPLAEAQEVLDRLPLDTIPDLADLPPGSRMPLARNPLFVGREADLMELAVTFKGSGTAGIGLITTATGLGGIGKTNLATEFVHRYGQFFAGGAFWLNFANAASIPAEIAACGVGLNLPSFADLTLDDQVTRIRQMWQEPIPRLLIFDNCEEEALLDAWRPTTGGCRILITSRRARWHVALGVTALTLDVLPRAQSIALLQRFRPDLAPDDRELDAIAAKLGDLPLALHLAGSYLQNYINSPFGDPAMLLQELSETNLLQIDEIQGEGSTLSPTHHRQIIREMFELTLRRLDPSAPIDQKAQALLMRTASFVPNTPIPRTTLLATLRQGGDARVTRTDAEALQRLINIGFITEAPDTLRIHPLVAAFAQELADDDARVSVERTLATEVLQAYDDDQVGKIRLLLPHLQYHVDRTGSRDDDAAIQIHNALPFAREVIGDTVGGIVYLERAQEMLERRAAIETELGTEILHNLAEWYRLNGRIEQARPLYEQALAIRERLFGNDGVPVAESCNNLGELLRNKGEIDEARRMYERALTIWTKHGIHGRILLVRNNLAICLLKQGQPRAAAEELGVLLTEVQTAFKPGDVRIGRTHQNLGEALRRSGDFDGAQSHLEAALAILQTKLGDSTPDTLWVQVRQAQLLGNQGQTAQGLAVAHSILLVAEQAHGKDHPLTELAREAVAELEAEVAQSNM